MLALSFRQGAHSGLKTLQPLGVVGDALNSAPGVGDPVDKLVKPDAVVVRVQNMIRLKPVLDLGPQGSDRFGDEIDWQSVIMSPLAIAISVELIEGARRDAGGHHGSIVRVKMSGTL